MNTTTLKELAVHARNRRELYEAYVACNTLSGTKEENELS